MSETLHELLEGNRKHVESLSEEHFSEVQEGQSPEVVSVCCSDSRVAQEGMWSVEEPGWLFMSSTIGNQVWDTYEDERVVDGSVLYPVAYTGTRTLTVVGHTGCGAVSAALEAVRGGGPDADAPPGVAKRVMGLVPVVEEGLDDVRVSTDRDAGLVDRLVEYNVNEQVEFLLGDDDVPDELSVYGFVYDFQGVYGDSPGRAYLVNADGETDEDALRSLVPDGAEDAVRSLL